MRIIVESFKDALELGLSKSQQVVVRQYTLLRQMSSTEAYYNRAAYDPNIRIWLAYRSRERSIPSRRPWYAFFVSCNKSYSSSNTSGGTNLRVCLVTLQGGGKFEITQSKYRLSEEQKQEDGQLLFDFCAECLKKFTDSNIESGVIEKGVQFPLGFTV